MTDARRLIRLSGLTLVAAGALLLPLVISGPSSIADVGTGRWRLVQNAAFLHHLLLLFGLFGLLAAQLRQAGVLGLFAFLVTSLGNAIDGGVRLIQLTALSALAGHPAADDALICTPFFPPATRSAAQFIARACESWDFGMLSAWFAAGRLSLMGGAVLLGVAIARAGVLPRAAGAFLALGSLVGLIDFFAALPSLVDSVANASIGAGYLWCGAALFASSETAPASTG